MSLVMRYSRDICPQMARDKRRLIIGTGVPYDLEMPQLAFRDAILQAAEARGISLLKLAQQAGVSYEQLKKLKQGKSSSTNVDDAYRVAQALGLTIDQVLNGDFATKRTIPIAGAVGAGASVPVFDVYGAEGDGPRVEAPPMLPATEVVAVEVHGNSMEPIYSAGDLLFYSRATHEGVPTEAIGYRCVCEDEAGMGWVKQVKLGTEPGLFNLISLNPGAENQHDVRLKWAARVLLALPAEMVRKAG